MNKALEVKIDIITAQEEVQKDRQYSDPWEECITEFFEARCINEFFTTADVLYKVLTIAHAHQDARTMARTNKLLKRLEARSARKWIGKHQVRGWYNDKSTKAKPIKNHLK